MFDNSTIKDILEQILDALQKIQWRFSPVKSANDFVDTPQGMEKLDSICMLLIAIGESCKNLIGSPMENCWSTTRKSTGKA
jgi:hypothetical protein